MTFVCCVYLSPNSGHILIDLWSQLYLQIYASLLENIICLYTGQ